MDTRSPFCNSALPCPASSASQSARYGLASGTSPSLSDPSPASPRVVKGNACTHDEPSAALNLLSTPFQTTRTSIGRLPTATDLASLKMPSLHCPFPALVHADYAAVKQPCDAWIEAVAKPPSASASAFLHDCLLPLFVCRIIPKSVSQKRLVHVIKAVAWLMIADDDDDHPDMLGSNGAITSQRADLVMAILRSEDQFDETSFDCSFLASIRPSFAIKSARMLKALAELWREIRQEMPASLRTRFISTMADYFEGLKVQAIFREKAIIPNVDSYMQIRRQASFTIPCFILMEYALGVEFDNATLYDPLIQELHNVVLDYISLCNDVVSCRIEIDNGDYFNLPSILYNSETSQWRFTTLQFVMDRISQMILDLSNHAIFLVSAIHEESKNFDPTMVSFVHAYVEGLSHGMAGALAWFLETARYQHANRQYELH
uniref:Terpene synthase n=1 Tax=Aglaomorpha bonii TaxID=272673 RepID=A0A7M3UPY7_9MONI|nr:MTPSL [Aglaomorpha bonii]